MPVCPDETIQIDTRDIMCVRRTLQGERTAFAELVRAYSRQLYALARRQLPRPEDAEEAVQDIFLKAFRGLPRFRLDARFHPWLFTIAVNHLRGLNRRRKLANLLFSNNRPPEAAPDRSSSPGTAPERALIEKEAEELVRLAIARLGDRRRAIYLLRNNQGFALADIAEIMRLPMGTVKTELFRARRQLAERLVDYGR